MQWYYRATFPEGYTEKFKLGSNVLPSAILQNKNTSPITLQRNAIEVQPQQQTIWILQSLKYIWKSSLCRKQKQLKTTKELDFFMQSKYTQNELDLMKYLKLLNIIIFLFSFEVGVTPKCLYKFYSEYLKKKKSHLRLKEDMEKVIFIYFWTSVIIDNNVY